MYVASSRRPDALGNIPNGLLPDQAQQTTSSPPSAGGGLLTISSSRMSASGCTKDRGNGSDEESPAQSADCAGDALSIGGCYAASGITTASIM